MHLNDIKEKLDLLGYHTYISSERLIVGKQVGTIPELDGIKLHNFCSLYFEQNNITVEFGRSNLPEWKDFSSESKAIDFIKETFKL